MITIGQNIIDGINGGDEKSFKALYDAYWSYLCSVATMYVPDPSSVEEIVNDVFLSVWKNRGHYRTPIHGYLAGSVRNACVSHLRSKMLKERLKESYEKELFLFAQENCLSEVHPLDLLSAKETEEKLREIVDTLPQRCREVFERYFYYEDSTKDISEKMDIRESTVRVQIKTALDRIRKELGPAVLLAYLFSGMIH